MTHRKRAKELRSKRQAKDWLGVKWHPTPLQGVSVGNLQLVTSRISDLGRPWTPAQLGLLTIIITPLQQVRGFGRVLLRLVSPSTPQIFPSMSRLCDMGHPHVSLPEKG